MCSYRHVLFGPSDSAEVLRKLLLRGEMLKDDRSNAGRRRTRRRQEICMPRGRSTFTKRQKERTRQQRQRDKAEQRNQRKQDKAVAGSVDEMAELRQHAAEQAALFSLGEDEKDTKKMSASDDRVGE